MHLRLLLCLWLLVKLTLNDFDKGALGRLLRIRRTFAISFELHGITNRQHGIRVRCFVIRLALQDEPVDSDARQSMTSHSEPRATRPRHSPSSIVPFFHLSFVSALRVSAIIYWLWRSKQTAPADVQPRSVAAHVCRIPTKWFTAMGLRSLKRKLSALHISRTRVPGHTDHWSLY